MYVLGGEGRKTGRTKSKRKSYPRARTKDNLRWLWGRKVNGGKKKKGAKTMKKDKHSDQTYKSLEKTTNISIKKRNIGGGGLKTRCGVKGEKQTE